VKTFTISAAQGNFFDSKKVRLAVDKSRRQILSRMGAFVRQRAITSIRKPPKTRRREAKTGRFAKAAGQISRPGMPPYSHRGLLRKFLFFAYDPERQSVVIGPARLNKPGNAPESLEYGGESAIAGRNGRTRKIDVRARPFMGPALDKELPNFPDLWRNSVR
jgi:hypothetical protein